MTMRCCASTTPVQPRAATNAAAAIPLPKRRMMIALRRLPWWLGRSLSADGKGVERCAHARVRGRDRPAKILEGGFEMTQIGDDVRLANRSHRADANNLAGLARLPRPGDDRAIALAHVLDDGAAFETPGHLHGDDGGG